MQSCKDTKKVNFSQVPGKKRFIFYGKNNALSASFAAPDSRRRAVFCWF
jgi:hypothetical protein